ncbi:MAG TPA: cytochrome c3 family protein, partial [Gemmataceae bacterium]|nr:cytochrome c3 family protein [Gemmataceae bacterium]
TTFPVPTLSASPFLNTKADAQYVGSAACRSCHAGEDASFRRTGMGRSLAEADPAREPPDATVDHSLSKCRYQVVRKDGRLWHRELLLDGQPDEVTLAEYPLKYAIGSGRHARSYVAEVDGFLVESPLTWYASRQRWSLSPGYDRPAHVGFGRGIEAVCLFCHAGQAEAVGGSAHRFQIREAALGCERCHGPGSVHVARHAAKDPAEKPADRIDYTIVNPAHLPRTLADAVCQQCHLLGRASPEARGRKQTDFRPGLPLQEFRHDYSLATQGTSLAVVGHVEQLQQSRCYQRSETLSCITCHNPHDEPRAQKRVAYYRAACLECHLPERCKVDAQRRQKESPDNDCTQCHMPRAATDVPHVAFTNHRIGVHQQPFAPQAETTGSGDLRPILDLSGLSAVDRQRSLGLAYAEWAVQQKDAAQVAAYRARAAELLAGVRAAGLSDPAVDVMLVRLGFDTELVRPYIDGLGSPELTPQDRCAALSLYAEACAKQQRFAEAVPALRQLVRLRRVSDDWQLLAYCERSLGNIPQSVEALTTAATIDPRLERAHALLAPYHRQRGDLQRADWHQRRAGRVTP